MAYDYSKLLGRITEKFGSQARFAVAMDLSERSLSLKLNGKTCWKQTEITNASNLLEISDSDIHLYFFVCKVHCA